MAKSYITTPIYYVNASAHIGHAYTNIVADCLARFGRLIGKRVFFLTGSDEHGEKIRQAALAKKQDTKVFVDTVVENFKSLWKALDISHDYFIRTTDAAHAHVVQEVIRKLNASGDIYKSKYEGIYCMPCETFYTESALAQGKCPVCKRNVERITEENYFFKLSRYAEWLRDYLKENPDFVKPKTRYNEVLGFLENNQLEDLCISRPKQRVSWGIDFPLDETYVVYVWFDALLNYISAIGYGTKDFDVWWPADVHFMAKDILRHHAVFWPIMLKALGLTMPKVVFAHGWWKIEEEKMSKSRGNIVNPFDLIAMLGPSGVDALRYFLMREIPLGIDGNFSKQALILRINSDLANDWGNLVYRTFTMSEKYFNANLKAPNETEHAYAECIDRVLAFKKTYSEKMERLEYSSVLADTWSFIGVMNKSIEDTKPWVLFKRNELETLNLFIWSLLERIRIIAHYVWPFMPQTSETILGQIGRERLELGQVVLEQKDYQVKKETPLFPRIDVD